MQPPAVLPRPAQAAPSAGPGFVLAGRVGVSVGPGTEDALRLVRELLAAPTGCTFAPAADGPLRLRRTEEYGPEGYRCEIDADGVLLAGDQTGLAHAIQTLRQLLPVEAYSAEAVRGVVWALPAIVITDRPEFTWRGALLDVGRWFRPLPQVLRFVDLLAAHHLNVLHLHLTEDVGWRMPIARYPLLTEVGGWRARTVLGHADRSTAYDDTPHGGAYTAAELRHLVEYARLRGISVVPEIDLPGHTQAAIAAYPELGNHPQRRLAVWDRWGISENVLNVELATVRFCCDVLDEVMDIFPSQWVHIGGDECPKTQWRASGAAQARMRTLGIAGEEQLQGWFTGELAAHVGRAGRRAIGWDEIVDGGLPSGIGVMSWRGAAGGIAAARAGHEVVMTPQNRTYFDYYQRDPVMEPLAIGGLTTLADVYAYRPVPVELRDVSARVLGTQGQLWAEYLPQLADVDRMAFPRLCALAEVAWGSAEDYLEFATRLDRHLARLRLMGVQPG